jgi:hypothetical protein
VGDNIKLDLRETGWDGTYWIDLAQDRDQWRALMNMVMNLEVSHVEKFSSRSAIGGFSRRAQLHGISYLVISLSSCFRSRVSFIF